MDASASHKHCEGKLVKTINLGLPVDHFSIKSPLNCTGQKTYFNSNYFIWNGGWSLVANSHAE